ncbi:MAG: DUF2254 domain-containing protein [Paracoccus sp. (in: a-proteobacteria)]|nr:DUF2254 domain-containing protein [Paracoccus sp. (in: a-proteobacteria)]
MSRHAHVGRFQWRLKELAQRLWVRVTAFAVLGVGTALTGFLLKDTIPDGLAGQVGADAIEPILDIIASSMLTVTTFSLSILTAAYATASSGATPRAVQLLIKDSVSQTVLATFIGAFVFSLVGLIMLKTQLYGDGGRVLLFLVTLLVIVIVVVSLLRWINRLGELGLIGDIMTRVETSTTQALESRLQAPWMGANPLRGAPPADSLVVPPPVIGHVQNCDMATLSGLAEKHGLIIYVTATPGDLVHLRSALFHVRNLPTDPDKADAIRADLIDCVNVRPTRRFEQDPRFGFSVLSEMAQRALSPAVNDPGTAVAVITRVLRILSIWQSRRQPEVEYPRLYAAEMNPDDLLRDCLLPLARDGASVFEVQLALQNCLLALTHLAPDVYGPAAERLSADFLVHARKGLVLKDHLKAIEHRADDLRALTASVVPLL